jgi:hypothetical protein
MSGKLYSVFLALWIWSRCTKESFSSPTLLQNGSSRTSLTQLYVDRERRYAEEPGTIYAITQEAQQKETSGAIGGYVSV